MNVKADWADKIDRDEFGVYAEINIKGVVQRLRYNPSGDFMMGSPEDELGRYSDEGPQKKVHVEGYWLFDTAVTQALWIAVMGENPSSHKGDPNLPVDSISWEDCKRFFEKINGMKPGLNLRFPTEAEWEYACRAGTTTPFSFGKNITTDQVNYDGNYPYAGAKKGEYREKTVVVKSLPPNPWGFYEMHGNLWEWVADKYGSYQDD